MALPAFLEFSFGDRDILVNIDHIMAIETLHDEVDACTLVLVNGVGHRIEMSKELLLLDIARAVRDRELVYSFGDEKVTQEGYPLRHWVRR